MGGYGNRPSGYGFGYPGTMDPGTLDALEWGNIGAGGAPFFSPGPQTGPNNYPDFNNTQFGGGPGTVGAGFPGGGAGGPLTVPGGGNPGTYGAPGGANIFNPGSGSILPVIGGGMGGFGFGIGDIFGGGGGGFLSGDPSLGNPPDINTIDPSQTPWWLPLPSVGGFPIPTGGSPGGQTGGNKPPAQGGNPVSSTITKALAALGLSPQNAALLSSILGLGAGALGSAQNANALAWARGALGSVYGNENTAANRGLQGFNQVAGQLTPGAQNLMGLGQNLAGTTRQLSPEMQALQQAIPGLMTRSAMTPQMQAILQAYGGALGGANLPMSAGGDILNSLGSTALTNEAAQGAGNIIGAQGNTPGSNLLGAFGQSALTSGGATPLSNYLGARGVDLTQQNPVFSPELAASMAKDLAGREYRKAQEQAQAQALLRGGGPGSVVATGQQNAGMADFADQAAANDAAQFENALTNQQGLGLQQFGQGNQMAQSAAGLNLQNLGLGTQAVGTGQGMANQQLLAALGLLPTTQNAQTNLFGTGGGIYGNALNTQLGGLNNIFGNTMSAQQLGLQQGQGTVGGLNNLFNTQMGLGSLGNSLYNSGSNNLQSILGGYNSSANTALGAQPGIFSGIGGLQGIIGSAWSPFLSNVGQVLAGQGTNLGGPGTGSFLPPATGGGGSANPGNPQPKP